MSNGLQSQAQIKFAPRSGACKSKRGRKSAGTAPIKFRNCVEIRFHLTRRKRTKRSIFMEFASNTDFFETCVVISGKNDLIQCFLRAKVFSTLMWPRGMLCINFMGGRGPVGVQSIRLQLGTSENTRAQTVLGPGHLFFLFCFYKVDPIFL